MNNIKEKEKIASYPYMNNCKYRLTMKIKKS